MKKYIKRQKIVEAIRYTGDNIEEINKWAGGDIRDLYGGIAVGSFIIREDGGIDVMSCSDFNSNYVEV